MKIAIIMMSFLLLAPAIQASETCPVGMNLLRSIASILVAVQMVLWEREAVSEEAWEDFVIQEITPRFPAGMTIVDTQGQFQESSELSSRKPPR